MKIRWVTKLLGTGAYADADRKSGAIIIDVRDLVDKAGNEASAVREKIELGTAGLRNGKPVIVCCDYGKSRSNAVAAGILTSFENRPFDDVLRQVLEATGETEIKLGPLMAVRKAVGVRPDQGLRGEQGSVLITGGSGFLGQRLAATMGEDVRVVAPSRNELDISEGSTRIDLLAEQENVTCVVHLANPRIFTSNIALGQTLTMLRNIIDVCTNRDIRLIYPSGWEIYSGYSGALRAEELTPPMPRGPYGETKYLAEVLIEHSIQSSGLRCALLRSSPVYGLGGDRPKFLWTFIEKALQSLPIVTHRYRNGEPALDLLHADDFVSAVLAVIRSNFVGSLNLGTGILTSTRQIARMIVDRLGSASRIGHRDIDADVACVAMDSRSATQKIGWSAKIDLEKGLEDILSHVKEIGEDLNG